MRAKHVAAALLVLLPSVTVTASCVQEPTAATETQPGEAQRPGGPGRGFQPKDFPFVVVVMDDGKEDGGGWQAADKTFHFVERTLSFPVYSWKCQMRIEMPTRCKAWGTVTPSRAARWSAEIATDVVDPLLDSRLDWRNQDDEFCRMLRRELESTFDERYPDLGARVRYNP